jgi:hypothetical protein
VVGELELSYNRIEVTADPGLMIIAYTAEPRSRSHEALGLLASWAATEEAHEIVSGDVSAHTSRPNPQQGGPSTSPRPDHLPFRRSR